MQWQTLKDSIVRFTSSPRGMLKLAGVALGGAFVIALTITVIGVALRFAFGTVAPYASNLASDGYVGMGGGSYESGVASRLMNVVPQMGKAMYAYDTADEQMYAEPSSVTMPTIVAGSANAENWESTDYNAYYRTRHYDEMKAKVEGLKPLTYVVFLSTNAGERSSSYMFNVESAHEDEIVALLQGLKPESWNASTVTIEHQVEDTKDEVSILERKLASLNETLAQAEAAFDSALVGARGVKDYTAIAQIVNNKVALVERLTAEKLSVQAQIDSYKKGLGRTTDEVAYTTFSVSIEKQMFIDWKSLADAWRYKFSEFINEFNTALHDLTFGVLLLILNIVKWLVYLAIIAGTARIVWVAGKKLWYSIR